MEKLSRFLIQVTAWALSRPRLILVMALSSALICIVLTATKLEMRTDQLELISGDHPLIKLTDRLEPFKVKSSFTVVVEAPSTDRAISYAESLADRIKKDREHFSDLAYRVDLEQMMRWGLLYLDEDDLLTLRDSLSEHREMVEDIVRKPDFVSLLKTVNHEMASRMVGELFTGFLQDSNTATDASGKKEKESNSPPMDLGFLISILDGINNYLHGNPAYSSPWSAFLNQGNWDLKTDSYFWTSEKRYLLMLVTPMKIEGGLDSNEKSLVRLRKIMRDMRASHPDVQAGVTGQSVINIDEMSSALGDMAWATWLSLLGVWLLMILFFRSLRRPFLELTSLGVGLCWTYGWATLVIGHLNIFSIVFAPMLCGLGVDDGIHWLARFEEYEKDPGLDQKSLILRVVEGVGPGIFHASISTSLAFFPFILTGFSGLMELGLISGMGMLFVIVADFTVLPVLSLYMAGRKMSRSSSDRDTGKKGLLLFTPRSAWLTLLLVGVISCIALVSAIRVGFDVNPLRLQAPNAESVVWEHKLIEGSSRSTLFASVLASSFDEVKVKSEALEALSSVLETDSVLTVLPKHQDRKIPILKEIIPLVPDVTSDTGSATIDVKTLSDILERIRFKMLDDQASKWGAEKPLVDQMVKVRELIQSIRDALQDPSQAYEPLLAYQQRFGEDQVQTLQFIKIGAAATPMEAENIPQDMKRQFYSDEENEFLIRVYPKGSIWEQQALSRFVEEMRTVAPDVVGDPVSLYVFASEYRKACIHATIYALIAIFILMSLSIGFKMALLGMAPLGIGALWTVGVMGYAGVDFNLANSIFLPLIFAAGVEYALIILYRWREGTMEPGYLPFSTGKGITLATFTTTLGFGALMISRHRGIYSLGFISLVGSLAVLAAAIIVLTAVLANGKRPPQEL